MYERHGVVPCLILSQTNLFPSQGVGAIRPTPIATYSTTTCMNGTAPSGRIKSAWYNLGIYMMDHSNLWRLLGTNTCMILLCTNICIILIKNFVYVFIYHCTSFFAQDDELLNWIDLWYQTHGAMQSSYKYTSWCHAVSLLTWVLDVTSGVPIKWTHGTVNL